MGPSSNSSCLLKAIWSFSSYNENTNGMHVLSVSVLKQYVCVWYEQSVFQGLKGRSPVEKLSRSQVGG